MVVRISPLCKLLSQSKKRYANASQLRSVTHVIPIQTCWISNRSRTLKNGDPPSHHQNFMESMARSSPWHRSRHKLQGAAQRASVCAARHPPPVIPNYANMPMPPVLDGDNPATCCHYTPKIAKMMTESFNFGVPHFSDMTLVKMICWLVVWIFF